MNYWEGYMNWPIKPGWVCETCGQNVGLTWGLPHAVCRCDLCHTQYYMRDAAGKVTDQPQSMLKEEYKEPAKFGFKHFKIIPISQWDDSMWDKAFELAKENEPKE